jgi:hypothetical protein
MKMTMNAHTRRGMNRPTAVAAFVFALAACDDGPTRPSPPVAPPGSGPNAPVTTRLEIVGPDTVPPGESAQFSAIAHQSDGSRRDVTNEALWRTSDVSVLTISPTGLATGRERGGTYINASAGGRNSSKEVIVVPAGTFRLSGIVRDTGAQVNGARVEVTAGTGRGLTATTFGGTYYLWGVAGDVEVRVTRDGFQEQRKRLVVTTHQELDFDLILTHPRAEVAGTYTLSVVADAACRAALPEEARIRNYRAVVRQDGRRLTVTLEGSTFYRHPNGQAHNSFDGTIEADQVTFLIHPVIGYYYYYLPSVIEELSPTSFFQISGRASTTVTPSGLPGTLNGRVDTLTASAPGSFDTASYCASSGHQFVLTR